MMATFVLQRTFTLKPYDMKHIVLFGALALGALTANAQQRTGIQTGTVTLGERAMDATRAVTDTLAPGSWANDPNTQLTQWGALCGPAGATFPCGYIVGTNGYGDLSKAQQFLLLDAPTTIVEGVLFWFYAKAGNPNSVVRARLYNMNGNGTNTVGPVTTGAPGTILASKDFTLAQVDTGDATSLGFTGVLFDNPTFVNTEFALGFNMGALAATDSLGLLATGTDNTEFPEFSWEQWDDNRWFTMRAAWGNPLNVDFCIFALLDNSSVGINEPGSLNNMRMSFINGNISNGTTLLGYDVVKDGRMELVIHNGNGQVVNENNFGVQGAGSYQHTINTNGWAAGVYYVTLKNNGQPLTKKLIVE